MGNFSRQGGSYRCPANAGEAHAPHGRVHCGNQNENVRAEKSLTGEGA